MELTAIVGDQTWQTPAWPLLLSVANAAVSLVLAGLLAALARRGGFGQRNVGTSLAILTPLLVALLCALPFALMPATLLSANKFALELFFVPLCGEVIASGVALCALGLGFAAWLSADRPADPGSNPIPYVPLLLLPVMGALGLGGPAHLLALNAQGALPLLDLDLGPHVHTGLELTAPVLLNDETLHGWYAPPVHVAPTRPGTFAIELRAQRVGLTGTRVVMREAGEDRGSPLFPLADKNTWDLEESVSRHAHYMWFMNGDSTTASTRIHISVEALAQTPLRTWGVSRQDDAGAPTHWIVYNWNGDVLDAATDEPFLTLGPADSPTEDGLRSCTLAVFPGWSCECGTPPPPPRELAKGWENPWTLAGPARCAWNEEPGALRTGFGALLAVVTVGLIIDMGETHHTVLLVQSGKAPS